MGLLDRLGEWDDRNVLYNAETNESAPLSTWAKLWIASRIFTVAFIAVLGALIGPLAAIYTLLVACVLFLVVMVVWRRRRNRRLTGSPYTWPKSH